MALSNERTIEIRVPTERLWRPLYPFRSNFIELDGHRYHYVDEGHGEVLLMVHGNPTWSFYWRELVKAWRAEYRVIAVDHIGCGLSDKPVRYPYYLSQHTANLVQLIDRLRLDDVTLLAHDWGGAIGLGAAVERSSVMRRFVLFNTGAFPPPRVPLRIAACRVPVLGKFALQGANLFARAALTMATNRPGGLPETVRHGMLAPYECWKNRVAISRFVADIPLTRRHPTYRVLETLERNLRSYRPIPVQLVWGMLDWCFTPKCLERFIEIFPRADVERLADAGHWVVEDETEEVIRRVSTFLKQPAGKPESADQAQPTSLEHE